MSGKCCELFYSYHAPPTRYIAANVTSNLLSSGYEWC